MSIKHSWANKFDMYEICGQLYTTGQAIDFIEEYLGESCGDIELDIELIENLQRYNYD